MTYSSKITAYDDEKEVGYTTFSRHQELHKGHRALYELSNTRANPKLSSGYALAGIAVESPHSEYYNYHSEGCSRYNGVVRREIKNRIDRTTQENLYTYSSINLEYPERLSGNISDFAISDDNSR